MPDAIITSTASTFGTITGTFAADQSTITGTVAGSVVGNLSGSVGVPGPAGRGVPAGGTAGQFLQKIDGVSYNTDWVTLNLSAYAPLNSPLFTGDPRGPTAALGDSDTSLATTAFVQQELASGTAVAKNLEVLVRNQSGSTIAAGSIVYISGATGNKPLITLAQANNDANSAQTMGFVKTAIANNGTGYVIVRGELENIDTSALTEGVQLYLSPTTAGAWTTTKPSAPQHLVYVGIVVRSHPTQGVILVAVQNGYELNELHDVAISSPINGQVLKYNSSTGLWYNGTDSSGVAWGGITGTLSSQTDLQTALDGKYSTTNPAGYITSSALSPYLTSATAASTYQTIAGMSSYLTTSAAASTYYPLTNPSGYITSSALTGYATESWVTSQGYITSSALTPYALLSGANFTGKVFTPASTTSASGFKITQGVAPSSPADGDIWLTSTDLQVRISGVTKTVADQAWVTSQGYITSSALSPYLLISTAASTYQTIAGMSSYLTTSAAASTYLTQANAASTYFTIANAANKADLASPTFTGVPAAPTATAGTSTTQIATTAFVTTADNLKANLASPTFTGTPAAPTAAADTNTTQVATTAFVVGQAGSATPLVDGTAAVGTSLRYARQDHVHPTDTTRAPLASPAFTGTPSLPTGTTAVTQTAGNNTTAVATTAFVQAAIPSFATTTQLLAGTSSTTGINPLLLRHALSNPGYTQYSSLLGNYSSYTGGAGTGLSIYSDYVSPYITSGGAKIAVCPSSTVNVNSFQGRGVAELAIDWTKPMWIAFRFHYPTAGNLGNTNTVCRVSVGKTTSFFGDLTSAGFGVKFTGGSTGAFTIMAHNGTTLTTSASAVTVSNTTYFPSTTSAADFLVYSDGAGNITLFCNNTQVATTTGGPSTGTTVQGRFAFETDNTTSTNGICAPTYSGIRSLLAY